jgi:predicted DNA-binding protein YlxM (UPF0122 family)
MSNIFNDLNKLVNTVQKVDKLLTEKPKRTRTMYFTKRFTLEEVNFLYHTLQRVEEYWMGVAYYEFYHQRSVMIDKLKKKFK